MARRELTVALSGDGGDECFLGYRRYQAMRWLACVDHLPAASRALAAHMLGAAPAAWQRRLRLRQIRDVMAAPVEFPARRYLPLLAFFTDSDKNAGYGEAMRGFPARSAGDLLAPHFAAAGGLVDGANRADIGTYLADDLMVKVDVAAMAHGLETRAPLLDHELVEWATALPPTVRMAGGALKSLFKSAMEPYLPREVLYRPKRGFGCPLDRWFRGELKAMAYDVLLSPTAGDRGLFRPDYVRRLLDEHCAGTADHQNRLWALLMLESWFRMWIDAPAEAALVRPAACAEASSAKASRR
jgi:asparagine synthase (glutamine-hydrolysing)